MDVVIIAITVSSVFVAIVATYLMTKKHFDNKIQNFNGLSEAIKLTTEQKKNTEKELTDILKKLEKSKHILEEFEFDTAEVKTLTDAIKLATKQKQESETELEHFLKLRKKAENTLTSLIQKIKSSKLNLEKINTETADLQALKANAAIISKQLQDDQLTLDKIKEMIQEHQSALEEHDDILHEMMGRIDLYSRIDDFISFGHFEMPEYLYETSERFTVEIKSLRDKQKEMLKNRSAFISEHHTKVTGNLSLDRKIIEGQLKLIMRAFNIECDLLISKVNPSNLDRSLSQIEKIGNDLEALSTSLYCGISNDYVALKYEECAIQYQYMLKKKEEHEEQMLIREQMREEAKAEKEYRAALEAAEKEETLYRELLEKARLSLQESSTEDKALTEAKIAALEAQLAQAENKQQRVQSMAELTRRGHVYVISNIGSFGENIFKIGMTRRLDPMDRVKELGDASVPFTFDVHAIIYADDAPAMETALHRRFAHHRVNAVNLRKEFFNVELEMIQEVVEEIGGKDVEFKKTVLAQEYFESKRLIENFAA